MALRWGAGQLDLFGDMLAATQEEGLAHDKFVADDSFKKLMVLGTNRMIGTLTSIYTLLRFEHIDPAAAQVRVLCEALITLGFVSKDPMVRADAFWGYYTIEAFETASAMVELERVLLHAVSRSSSQELSRCFLALWSEAEPDLPLLQKAQNEYAQLR